jgi:hypothetical protein
LNPYKEKKPIDHFQLSNTKNDFLEGKTIEGKKTIEICDLNRELLKNTRIKEWKKVSTNIFKMLLSTDINQIIPDDMEFSLYLKLKLESVFQKGEFP